MAVGKNKLSKKKKVGGSSRKVDPFIKKEWYDLKAPSVFAVRDIGKTVCNKTVGQRQARDNLLGRVVEVSLGDLKQKDEDAFRKFKLRVAEVQGKNALTQFYGMDLTTDKLRSLIRKWQTLIECYTDVKTTDGYVVRLFAIGFTKRAKFQQRKTSYAQSAQVKNIRKKMIQIIQKEAGDSDLAELVSKLQSEIIGKEIEKHTQGIYPLHDVLIRKAKMMISPKVDVAKLLEQHGGADAASAATPAADAGAKLEATA